MLEPVKPTTVFTPKWAAAVLCLLDSPLPHAFGV